MSVGFLTDT